MSIRALVVATLVVLSGCGGEQPPEVRVLAPPDLLEGVERFERESGCRADTRAYDAGEDLGAIAERRNVDVFAEPVSSPAEADDAVQLARVVVSGVEVTIPARLAGAFGAPVRPAGTRLTAWRLREGGGDESCARRWVAYAAERSQ
jgi:hypothetical protein